MLKDYLPVVLLFFIGFPSLKGDTLAYELFEYPNGTLQLANGGSGWFREWRNTADYSGLDGYIISDVNPMSFEGLNVSGGYTVGGYLGQTSGRYFDPVTFAPYLTVDNRIGNGNFYLSFLIRKEEENDDIIQVVFADDETRENLVNIELIKIGYFGTVSEDIDGNQYWSIAVNDEETVALSDSIIRIGDTYRIVVEFNFGPTSTFNLWVNPSVDNLNTIPDATVNTTADVSFWNMVLSFISLTVGDHGSFDEFVFTDNISNVLPVELSFFRAKSKINSVLLEWETINEINNNHFLIEKSVDGSYWQTIGMRVGYGDSNESRLYSLIDLEPYKGDSFYRLIQVDHDGTKTIEKIIFHHYMMVEGQLSSHFSENRLFISSSDIVDHVYIHSLDGKLIMEYQPQSSSFDILLGPRKEKIYLVTTVVDNQIIRQKVIHY